MDYYKWSAEKRAWFFSYSDKDRKAPKRAVRRGLGAVMSVLFLSVFMLAAVTQIDLGTQVKGILPGTNGGTGISSTATFPASGTIMTTATGVTAAQLPNPSTSTLGGVESLTCSAGSHLNSISTSGIPSCTTDTAAPNLATHEIPSGTINGVTTSFTLLHTPVVGSQECFLNGNAQDPGSGNDYTISGAAITYLIPPATGAKLWCDYRW
jgi:hypothetical protein